MFIFLSKSLIILFTGGKGLHGLWSLLPLCAQPVQLRQRQVIWVITRWVAGGHRLRAGVTWATISGQASHCQVGVVTVKLVTPKQQYHTLTVLVCLTTVSKTRVIASGTVAMVRSRWCDRDVMIAMVCQQQTLPSGRGYVFGGKLSFDNCVELTTDRLYFLCFLPHLRKTNRKSTPADVTKGGDGSSIHFLGSYQDHLPGVFIYLFIFLKQLANK